MKKYIAFHSTTIIFFTVIMLFACSNPSGKQIKDPKLANYNGKYICISLNRYVNEFSRLFATSSDIPADVETMFGMSWINGYVIDSVNKDVILVGQQKKDRPGYYSEDIFTNYQNVFDSVRAPSCSLDPYPENVLKLNHCLEEKSDDYETQVKNCQEAIGGQKVVVDGVPLNSRAAKIMIYADYEMKKISQGLLHVPGVKSAIDLAIEDTTNSLSASTSFSRYWLHIKKNSKNKVYPNFSENEGIVFLNECPVVVLTEKQHADARGNLTDVSEKDKLAISFAAQMSNHYTALAAKNELFAELENMFRLQACLRAMKFNHALHDSRTDFSDINGFRLSKGNELPASLPGLINYKITQKKSRSANEELMETRFYIIAGGVDQEINVNGNNFSTTQDNDDLLMRIREKIINQRPRQNSIHWNIIFSQ